MKDFFERLYEWFGLLPLYSKDLAEFLKGLDFACTGYLAIPWYVYIGWIMLTLTILIFALQYDIIDVARFKRRRHFGLAAIRVVIFNFLVAFAIPFVALKEGAYCHYLKFTIFDCLGFGISNAFWSVLLFAILTAIKDLIRAISK